MEMHHTPGKKICRPRQVYTGSLKRDYTPLSKRS
jgi:citrate synthase